jgi:hypothetical protein
VNSVDLLHNYIGKNFESTILENLKVGNYLPIEGRIILKFILANLGIR